jgi:hypothetical protein
MTSIFIANFAALVIGLMFVAWISHYLVQKVISKTRLDKFYSASSVMFQVLGSIAGVMQAFVVVSFWNDYQDTANSTHQEVENLTVTYRNITLLADGVAKEDLLTKYIIYVRSVVKEELPGHSQGSGANPSTQQSMNAFWDALQKLAPEINTQSQQVIFQAIIADANAAAKLRQHRINGLNSSDADLLWIVLIASSLLVMVIMGTLNIGQKEGLYYLLSFSLACIFSLMITVSYDYSRPYQGTIILSNSAYLALIESLTKVP